MNAKQANARQPKPRQQARRVIDRLLAAVDKSIAAADEAKQARDELVRLVSATQEAGKMIAPAHPLPTALDPVVRYRVADRRRAGQLHTRAGNAAYLPMAGEASGPGTGRRAEPGPGPTPPTPRTTKGADRQAAPSVKITL